MRLGAFGPAGAAALALQPARAFAHASERGHVLLLPTGYYLIGGALAVAASFVVLAFVRPMLLVRYAQARLDLAPAPRRGQGVVGFLSFAVAAALVAAGFLGSPDPLHNPLPTTFWTLFWVGFTLLQGLFGNLWSWLNPWRWPYRFLTGRTLDAPGPRALPNWLGLWPAVALLAGFVRFELVDLAPEDPRRLAAALAAYWAFTFVGCLAFGYRDWMARCEFLSVFFGLVARFSILDISVAPRRLMLCWPGARLADAPPLPVSAVVFLLAALGSVSFDGLSRTFSWLGFIGINPLDFPGRSAVVRANTIGLALTVATLAALFFAAVWSGERFAGARAGRRAFGLLVWSIVPIALAYHFAHYLTALLVEGQYALVALSDPFSRGWNLLGLTGAQVHAGVTIGHGPAWSIWNAQAAAIVGGHVLAVLVAHMLGLRLHGEPRRAAIAQTPLAVLMVGYTLLGLWLMSAPSIG